MMKALARLGIALGTGLATWVLAFFSGGDAIPFLTDAFGDPAIAGIVAGGVSWVVGYLVKLIPKEDATS